MKKLLYLLFCIFFLILFACSPKNVPTFSENSQTLSTEYNPPFEIPKINEDTLETLTEPIETIDETTLDNESPVDTIISTETTAESPADTIIPAETAPETLFETNTPIESIPETTFETVPPETAPDTVVEIPSPPQQPLQTEAETQQEVLQAPEYAGSIALTFDDGPGKYTERLLDILKKHNSKATFFVVGNRASYQKDKLKRMVDEGHEVGNHTYSHISLKELEVQEIINQIVTTKNLIQEATGVESNLVRAPYGDLSPTIRATGGEQNVAFIHWSLDSFDWKTRDAQAVYDEIISRVKDGDIILLHDIHESTIDAMELVIPELINSGYKLVTVSELLLETRESIIPGAAYVRK